MKGRVSPGPDGIAPYYMKFILSHFENELYKALHDNVLNRNPKVERMCKQKFSNVKTEYFF